MCGVFGEFGKEVEPKDVFADYIKKKQILKPRQGLVAFP